MNFIVIEGQKEGFFLKKDVLFAVLTVLMLGVFAFSNQDEKRSSNSPATAKSVSRRLFSPLLLVLLLCSACQQSEDSKVMDIVMNVVNKKGFLSASVDDKTRTVDLEIADTENASKVKKEINAQLKNQNIRPYTINVSQKNMDIVKKEHRRDRIYSDIFNEVFMKRGYKGFTIRQANVLNQPITIAINTTINISDPGAKGFGKKIEKEVDDLLNTKKVKKWVENDSYSIEIYSQDGQLIN